MPETFIRHWDQVTLRRKLNGLADDIADVGRPEEYILTESKIDALLQVFHRTGLQGTQPGRWRKLASEP